MSKFFKGGQSSSESSDSDSSDDAPVNRQPTKGKADFNFLSESEDESPKRIVRASKDKVYDELKENIKTSRNAEKIKDFTKLLTVFESITKSYDKAKTVMNREGLTIPRFYIRYLVELEDFINAAWDDKDARQSLSKIYAKSLSAIRQKIHKYNRDFDTEISAFREGPDPVVYVSDLRFDVSFGDDTEDEDWGSDSDDSSESDIELEGKEMEELRKYFLKSTKSDSKKTKKQPKEHRIKQEKQRQESDDEGWNIVQVMGEKPLFPNKNDITIESYLKKFNEVNMIRGQLERKEMDELRKYFLKSTKSDSKKTKKQLKKHRVKQEKQRQESDDEGWNIVQVMAEKPLFPNKNDITIESYLKKFNEVNMIRGRKSTNSRAHLRYLQECYDIAVEKNFGPGVLVKVRLTIISALFEMDTKINAAMDYNAWNKTRAAVATLFDLLKEHPQVIVSVQTNDEEENFHQEDKPYRING
uniref:Eukaryotic translation initiation factor 3 subunit C N-terminal domain-containing protein n=1 Tax=Panagrolaimus sp. ES5 TaxID=591445 RepID=A0AC34G6Q6_9BILA